MSLKRSATSCLRQLEHVSFRLKPQQTAISSRCLARQQPTLCYRAVLTQKRSIRTTAALHLKPSLAACISSSGDSNKPVADESTTPPSKIYSYEDVVKLSETPDPSRIIIDVREPAELTSTGRIPTALNVPITSSPDAFFLPESEFIDRFGFPRPGPDVEVVFYCKAGVRSKAAARLAAQADPPFAGAIGEFPGSWNEWAEKGGKVER